MGVRTQQPLGRGCEVKAFASITSVWQYMKQPGVEICPDISPSSHCVIPLQPVVSYISQNAFQQHLEKGQKLLYF